MEVTPFSKGQKKKIHGIELGDEPFVLLKLNFWPKAIAHVDPGAMSSEFAEPKTRRVEAPQHTTEDLVRKCRLGSVLHRFPADN